MTWQPDDAPPGLYWKLDGRTPVPATALEHMVAFARGGQPHVALDAVRGITVSTIFLGINTSLVLPPRVFETMIFGGPHDHYQVRVATWEEAEAEHARALRIAGIAQ